ncbi:MAG: enoyl-CoA hydratase/isomerase family protein [Clostridiales Family XIII bacterium]|jgi:enoyl-CoA hydratase|nr:enoyl-CoA hydratase/isomerase family protein [Clostridiales Family XIII bacterium]
MERVVLNISDGVANVTLNTPDTYNALTKGMVDDLYDAFESIEEDPDAVVTVVTGAGKAFAAGADISTFLTSDQESSRAMSKFGQKVYGRIAGSKTAVIAAVNGAAFGGGLELAACCDIRIASEKAKFGAQEAAWGLLPGWGGTQRLPWLVGRSNAMKILLTGDIFDAVDAYRMGFVSEVSTADEFTGKVEELAKKIARNGPDNIYYIKRCVSEGAGYTTSAGLALENESLGLCFLKGVPGQRAEAFFNKKK